MEINKNAYKNDHSVNVRGLNSSDYAVCSSFKKKHSTDLWKPVQLNNLSVNNSINKGVQLQAKTKNTRESEVKQR